MASTLARRLARVEASLAPSGRLGIVAGPADMPVEQILAALGITAVPSDLVIVLNRFGDDAEPALISASHSPAPDYAPNQVSSL